MPKAIFNGFLPVTVRVLNSYVVRMEEYHMNENLVKRNECLAQTVIKGLQSRNCEGTEQLR